MTPDKAENVLRSWDSSFGLKNARATLEGWCEQGFARRYYNILKDRDHHQALLTDVMREVDLYDCFLIARWQPNENVLSDVVASLFDPSWGHPFAAAILQRVLFKLDTNHITAANKTVINNIIRSIENDSRPFSVRREVRGARSRADIDIFRRGDFLVRIEHKLRDGRETEIRDEKQTDRLAADAAADYDVQSTIFVFLSPTGKTASNSNFLPMSYHVFSEAVLDALGLLSMPRGAATMAGFLNFYRRWL